MSLFNIIKNTKDFKMLEKEAGEGTLSQAILLQTKDELYASEFAKALTMLILDGGKACQTCEHCQKVEKDAHPDVKKYPQKDKLLVADSEEIVAESFIRPIFADKKVFIIENIDNSMDSAQNKLLKTLEEPTKNVYLILTCKNAEMVLPTIRSRCNKIQLEKLNKNEISKVVSDRLAIDICDGYIGKAIALSKCKNLEEICERMVSVLCDMKHSSQVLKFSKQMLDNKNELLLSLEIFAIAIEDLLKIKSGNQSLVRLPFRERLSEVQSDYSVRALCEIALLIERLSKEKAFNINFTLAIENFLLNILEVKYLCK
jgi:DNA polymerase-3 subunit delta'